MDLPGIDSYVAEYRWLSTNGIFLCSKWGLYRCGHQVLPVCGERLVRENRWELAVPGGGFKLPCCGAGLQPEKRSSASPESLVTQQSPRSAHALN